MRSAFASLALAALVAASPMPGGVSSAIAPSTSAPPGCSPNYSGTFEIQVVNVTSSGKRDIQQRDTPLVISLKGGILTDSQGRTGYIASNSQFQFDDPPQAGAIYTAGFSVCANNSLAIGGDALFYKCLSGTFYNLYDNNDAGQCSPVYIEVVSSGGSATTPATTPAATTGVAAESSDGQITATPTVAAESSDGQITANPVSTTASAACTEYVDGQPQCPSAVPTPECSEYVDGQPQCATSAAPTPTAECSEYVDGQPQCSSAAPTPTAECSEYVDGQPQCSSAAPSPTAECSEYVDGQPQCSSAAPTPTAACSEYVDGQPQCSTAAVQPSYYTTGGAPPASYTGPAIATGAASPLNVQKGAFGIAAGVLAFAVL